MTLIKMDSQIVATHPAMSHLCDVILETLQGFLQAANDVKAFYDEIYTLRKFLDLIDRVFKARLTRMSFEEQHFACVEVLLGRCRSTLSRLYEILSDLQVQVRLVGSQEAAQKIRNVVQDSDVVAVRARVGFFTQTLQMSLQTVKL